MRNRNAFALPFTIFVCACSGSSDEPVAPVNVVTDGGASGGGGGVSPDSSAAGDAGSGPGGSVAAGGADSHVDAGVRLPTANAKFDYQIGGAYAPPAGVQIVSRDRNDAPAQDLYNICYVNGFQTQSGDASFWETNHPDLVLRDAGQSPVVDSAWNEMLLDVTTPDKRTRLVAIVGAWIEKCAADGFDAVEIDNLDSYSRSQNLITQEHTVAFMSALSAVAHASGLAVAQKNTTELVGRAADMGTDFAIAEECNRWGECADYEAAYGDLVFVIEYRDQDFQAGCTDFPELSIVRRDLNVTAPGSASYVYDAC